MNTKGDKNWDTTDAVKAWGINNHSDAPQVTTMKIQLSSHHHHEENRSFGGELIGPLVVH
jgi:hypothetical protein